jgi:SAM-dependent methyltransferase
MCRNKGFEVQARVLEEVEGFDEMLDLLTAFELFDHLFDPLNFLNHAKRLLKPGGYLLMTMINCRGFDISFLGKKSKSFSAPLHLNFFNTKSINLLLEKSGFEIIRISTPGKLDWDIIEGMINNEDVDMGRFWNLLAKEGSGDCKTELQNWISRQNMSSHMRILVKK